jgi:predicted N-formylglutamate amidohydrolase
MNLIKSLKSVLERSIYHNINDSQLVELSKTTLFRNLAYKEKQAVEVFDFRDIGEGNPNNNVIITCEHASNHLHKYRLQGKEIAYENSHWAYDPGAKDITLDLSEQAKVLSIYSNFSRLIIDPNRSLLSETLIRRFIEKDIELEMNQKCKNHYFKIVDVLDRDKRIEIYYCPYYKILREVLLFTMPKYVISSHSFTPIYEDQAIRDYEVGLLYREKGKMIGLIEEAFKKNGIRYKINEPYDLNEGVCHVQDSILRWNNPDNPEVLLIEFRNDFAVNPKWKKRMINILTPIIKSLADDE